MLKVIKRFIKSRIWRCRNPHNFTTLDGDSFPLNKVSVGKMTYGSIRAISYGGQNELLKIGDYCSIADGVSFLLGGGHRLDTISTYPFRAKILGDVESLTKGPIVVENDVWIGYGATILSGVTLGCGCVVGAGALVNKDVPPYAIVAGVPAKVIRFRFSNAMISELLDFSFDNLESDFVRRNISLFERPIDSASLKSLKEKLSLALMADK